MHKININLHNLKTALIFRIEISRDYSSRHGLRMCQITKKNCRSAAEIRGGGGGIHPPPPSCEMGSKDPASLGLRGTVTAKWSGPWAPV